jgi:hypothetical protein
VAFALGETLDERGVRADMDDPPSGHGQLAIVA